MIKHTHTQCHTKTTAFTCMWCVTTTQSRFGCSHFSSEKIPHSLRWMAQAAAEKERTKTASYTFRNKFQLERSLKQAHKSTHSCTSVHLTKRVSPFWPPPSPLFSFQVKRAELPSGPTFSHIPLKETYRAEDRQLWILLHTMLTREVRQYSCCRLLTSQPAGEWAGGGRRQFTAESRHSNMTRVIISSLSLQLGIWPSRKTASSPVDLPVWLHDISFLSVMLPRATSESVSAPSLPWAQVCARLKDIPIRLRWRHTRLGWDKKRREEVGGGAH